MARLLIGHELDEETVTSSQTSGIEILFRESSQDVVEEVEFNPLLVKTKKNRLIIEVGLYPVDWLVTRST